MSKNLMLYEPGESHTNTFVRDRSKSIKISVPENCSNSTVSTRRGAGDNEIFSLELESNYTGFLDPALFLRGRTSIMLSLY